VAPALSNRPSVSIVIPTIGRPSLAVLLRRLDEALAEPRAARPAAVVLADDRPAGAPPLELPALDRLAPLVRQVRTGGTGSGRGPAAARNAGWRATATEWVALLDDDVVPDPDWLVRLAADLGAGTGGLPADVGGSQGRVRVPLPADRAPTDWERNTAGLAGARWITADMAYRRSALAAVGGFEERFPRAFREDSDLALRVLGAGYRLVRGERRISHPVRPADRWASVRAQAGNADDVLMRRLHGPRWRQRAGVGPGRRPRHLAVAASGVAALALAPVRPRAAAAAAACWAAGTAELAAARIRPGPRTRDEVTAMVLSSAALPFAASAHWLRGLWRHRSVRPWTPPAARPGPDPLRAAAVDRPPAPHRVRR
jgi:cellulose synthase/poly-beta-1,6-N-acetylglucosamine synthase-like glycosyltransferase